jgi:predicted  nucleic acid-binding Zn ribbon protein
MLRKHGVLLIGVVFAVGAMVAWQSALKTYTRSLGMIKSGESSYHINLEHVAQHMAAHREQTLEQWLGPVGAQNARQQQAQYGGRFAAALLCGFMTLFCLGMYLDGLKERWAGAGQTKTDTPPAG